MDKAETKLLAEVAKIQEGNVSPPQSKSEYFDARPQDGFATPWAARGKTKTIPLQQAAGITKGRMLRKKDAVPGYVPVIGGGAGVVSCTHNEPNAAGGCFTISASGSHAGYVWWHGDPIWASDCLVVRSKDENAYSTLYLYMCVKSRQREIYTQQQGTGQPHIYKSHIEDLPIPEIEIKEQRKFASLLSALDSKIELNRQTNETLEAMARALFKDWFIDFGPTHAKMKDGNPYLGPDLWPLFPTHLDKETGLPEGWSYSTVGERFDVRIGRTPPRKEAWHFTDGSDGVPWLSIRDLGECGVYVNDTSEGLTEKSVIDCRVPVVESGTILVSFKLTVGRVAISSQAMTTNEAIAHLNPGERSPSPYFTYCWMSGFDYSRLGSTSSIATAVNSQTIKEMPFPNFDSGITDQFAFLVEPLFQKIEASTLESRALAQTLDHLLPKLMSGEIRLREADQIAGEML